MADTYSTLSAFAELNPIYKARFAYRIQIPDRDPFHHTLLTHWRLLTDVNGKTLSPLTIADLFNTLTTHFLKPLCEIQSCDCRCHMLEITLLYPESADKASTTYSRRLQGYYGAIKTERSSASKAFKYELGFSERIPGRSRLLNVRGVPESFSFFDMPDFSPEYLSAVNAIERLFVYPISLHLPKNSTLLNVPSSSTESNSVESPCLAYVIPSNVGNGTNPFEKRPSTAQAVGLRPV